MVTHQPKGGMCGACAYRLRVCDHLDFTKMQPIGKYPDGTIVVKCTEFIKRITEGM